MSTYLAIIFVGKYVFKEADLQLSGNKTVRVYAPPYMIERGGGDYPAEVAQKVMTYFEDYFQIQYKLSKYDSAAIPDFQFSAMENYGLVTYRPSVLMYFQNETSETERKRISQIISHESAHQWFGNLITAKWWNDIWLNEGFATYLAPKGSNYTDPEFEAEKAFLNDVVQYSMPFDSDPTYTHPVHSSELITEPFYDRINYEKAASLIRMMEGFLTPNTLQEGLRKFLDQLSFQGAEQDDLFIVLTEQAHIDGTLPLDTTVKEIMDTWTLQAGFPLVRVTSGGPNSVYISQERFVALSFSSEIGSESDLWNIPLSIATESAPTWDSYIPKLWLGKDVQLTTYEHNSSEWILLNLDGTGYYRVLYDLPLLSRIITQLDSSPNVIGPLSRSQLIDDYFKSAFMSHVNIEYALELTNYLSNERDAHVWDTVLTNLEYTYRMMLLNEGFVQMKNHFLPKLEAALSAIGVGQGPNERGNIVLYRLQLLDWACAMDSSLCRSYVNDIFGRWQQDNSTFLPLDLQPIIFCTAVANNFGSNAFEHVIQAYGQNYTLSHQKVYLLNALACSREVHQLSRLLEEIVNNGTDTAFPDTDARLLLQRVVSNPTGRYLAFNALREDLDSFIDKFDLKIVTEVLTAMSSYTNSDMEKANIENFINENSLDDEELIRSELERILASIEGHIQWMNRFGGRIKDWFQVATANVNLKKRQEL